MLAPMFPFSAYRFVLGVSAGLAGATALLFACSESESTLIPESDAGSVEAKDGAKDAVDAALDARDASKDARIVDATPGKDANGPGEAGTECSFNRECQAALRCDCDGFCACQPGVRGTGRNGVDTCDSGNQCASSVCVEQNGGVFLCSDECVDEDDCEPGLPLCVPTVGFDNPICVRQP